MRLLALSLLLLPTAALSQSSDPCLIASQASACVTLITTHGTATTRIPNTAVDVSAGITATGKDLATVQAALATQADALLTYLRGQKAQRLITTDISFSPDSREQKNAPDKIVGYNGSTHVSFRLTTTQAPDVLAGVLEHGANTIDQTTFTATEAEIDQARAALSAEATQIALAQAQAVAKSASMRVLSTRSVTVDGNGSTIQPMFHALNGLMMAAKMRSMPTASGEQAISMQVDVVVAAAR